MGKLNREWHEANKMAKNPSEDQRLTWHVAHADHCTCREMSPKLLEEVKNWKAHKHIG
jgi:hypothetical protein